MKSLTLLLTITLVAPVSMALAENSAETHSEKTDAAGTKVTTEASHSDSVGITGTKTSTADAKTVVDPKGMLNAKTTESHSELKVKPDGDFSKTDSVEHANGTDEEVTSEHSTSKNWTNKGKTETNTVTKSVDPKGLGNSKSVEVKEIVETNPDGSVKKTITKEVDGETVSKEMKVTE